MAIMRKQIPVHPDFAVFLDIADQVPVNDGSILTAGFRVTCTPRQIKAPDFFQQRCCFLLTSGYLGWFRW